MTTFRAVLQQSGKTAVGIPVPEEVVLGFARGKRVPVVVTIGDYSYRSTVAPWRGEYMISLSAENRAGAGVNGGEEVEVTIEVDDEPRSVDVPADLAAALDAVPAARAAFDKLSYSNQKAHVLSVEDAKTPETRERRIGKVTSTLAG